MIDIKHLAQNEERYAKELEIRGGNPECAMQAKDIYDTWKSQKIILDELLQKKNDFNKTISSLSAEKKQTGLSEMKVISDEIKQKESDFKNTSELLTKAISKIPNLSYDEIPV
jgi:seryl-tRNA synthetase